MTRFSRGMTSVILFHTVVITTGSSQWTQTEGPYGGSILSFLATESSLYAGTEGGSVFLSKDDGLSWSRLDLGAIVRRVSDLETHNGYILSATDEGVFRTADGGNSWLEVSSGIPDTAVTCLASVGAYVLAGVRGHGLFGTSDAGESWNLVYPEPDVYSIFSHHSGVFAGTRSGLLFSADTGVTWEVRGGGFGSARCFNANSTYLVAGSGSSVWRSGDDGVTWTRASNGLNIQSNVAALLVSGEDLFAGTFGGGVYQSTNSGDDWYPVNGSLENLFVNSLFYRNENLLAGTEGGVFVSTENGANWVESNDGLSSTKVRSIVTVDGTTLLAGTRGGGIYRSTDGSSWITSSEGITNPNVVSLAVNDAFVFAGTVAGGVFRSTDKGTTWDSASAGLTDLNVHALKVSGTRLLAGTESGIFESLDSAQSWSFRGLDTTVNVIGESGFLLYAGTGGAGLQRSTDGGSTWERIGESAIPDDNVLCVGVSGRYLYAGTEGHGIYRSEDNGSSWTGINAGLSVIDTLISDIVVQGENVYISTNGQGAYYSVDLGSTWTLWNEGLQTTSLQCLFLVDSTMFAGTFGGGVEKRQIPPSVPALTGPEDNSPNVVPPVTFSWSGAPGAASYDLEIGLSEDFRTLAFDESGPGLTYVATTLARRTTYFWRVRASGPGGKSTFSNVRSFTTSPTYPFTSVRIHDFPTSGLASTDYRLISIPGSTRFAPEEIFPGAEERDWRIFSENGGEPPDHLTELSGTTKLETGRGYWAISKGPLDFTRSVTMPSPDSLGIVRIDVGEGWNIIGNPFELSVDVNAVRIESGDSTAAFHSYRGKGGFATADSVLDPFTGYYYFNQRGLDSLAIPYPFPARQSGSVQKPAVSWSLQLVYEADGIVDSRNFVGAAVTASSGKDMHDVQKPPLPGDQPFLVFHRPEWNERCGMFSSDFRPMNGEGEAWTFAVENPRLSEGTIRVLGVGTVPGNAGMVLLNTAANERVDLRAQTTYTFRPANGTTQFLLLVGPEAFIRQELEGTIPREFELSQNYPNPFNPSTSISVGIPKGSNVELEVVSVLGQRTATITAGWHEPGRYTFSWNGRDLSGRAVSSGVYFYRLIADGTPRITRKMVLLR